MSEYSDVAAIIRKFILRQFPAARYKEFTDNDPLLDSGIIDSMGILEIVTFIEDNFPLTITDEDLTQENFKSVESLSDFIAKKTSTVSKATL